jgi:sucrose-6F-phosphate phosphohydrolase
VGTSLTDGLGNTIAGFTQRFHEGWDRALVQETVNGLPGLTPQPLRYQSPFKASWFWLGATPSQVADLSTRLTDLELQVLVVYSSERDLDVLPLHGGKGNALRWLCDHLGITTGHAVVAGDSENDLTMFHLPQVRGILVANATAGLAGQVQGPQLHRAMHAAGDGVIEGLRAFGLGNPGHVGQTARLQRRERS